MKIFHLLEDACHNFDMQLAFLTQPTTSTCTTNFLAYCMELQKLQVKRAKCAEALDELSALEEVTSYIAISLGKDDPITKNFLKEINEKKKVVQMVRCEIHCNTLDQQ